MYEWHNMGEWRFGLSTSRFQVLRRSGWLWWRKYEVVTSGAIKYGIVEDVHARVRAAIEISPGLHAADLRRVVFETDDVEAELDPHLCACMAARWHEMRQYGTPRE
jgi:hypothetical protein